MSAVIATENFSARSSAVVKHLAQNVSSCRGDFCPTRAHEASRHAQISSIPSVNHKSKIKVDLTKPPMELKKPVKEHKDEKKPTFRAANASKKKEAAQTPAFSTSSNPVDHHEKSKALQEAIRAKAMGSS